MVVMVHHLLSLSPLLGLPREFLTRFLTRTGITPRPGRFPPGSGEGLDGADPFSIIAVPGKISY